MVCDGNKAAVSTRVAEVVIKLVFYWYFGAVELVVAVTCIFPHRASRAPASRKPGQTPRARGYDSGGLAG